MGDHTESVQIHYDPAVITYHELLAEFWSAHRPLQPARSRQYASVIFYSDQAQREAAETSKQSLEASVGTLYTDIAPLHHFYLAEEYHQHYYAKNGMLGGAACATGL